MSSAWLTQKFGSADNAAPRTTADVHEGVARGDRPADQFQRPAPHRRGEAISHLAFRAGIQDTVFLVDLFCLHPLRPYERTILWRQPCVPFLLQSPWRR